MGEAGEAEGVMARHRLLGWLDRGNQRAVAAVRSNPDAGVKVLPYAKSDSARRKLIATAAIVGIVGLIFGWTGVLLACAVAVPLVWKLEHHYFVGRNDTDEGET
ncbi:MAG: hypothetical protein WCC60_18945 [Ilumatobacteraceae bacterium]